MYYSDSNNNCNNDNNNNNNNNDYNAIRCCIIDVYSMLRYDMEYNLRGVHILI